MELLIGVDEAGYGPNFGPLVVAATAWRVEAKAEGRRGKAEGRQAAKTFARPASNAKRTVAAVSPLAAAPDLYKRLSRAVVRSPLKCQRRVAIADSKALYKAGFGVRLLERGVLAALAAMRASGVPPSAFTAPCTTVGSLLDATRADPDGRRRELPCHCGDEHVLPVEVAADELEGLAAMLGGCCEKNGVALVGLRVRLVFPAEFNDLVDHFGTKGAALSHVTLAIVRELIDGLVAEQAAPALIYFDKHGGRSRYAALLQHHFSECWIEPLCEGRAESRYRWEHRGAPVEAAFRVGCEAMLPTALASMAAKYHRELIMRAFNAFWTSRVPGLRPTAGYPADAHRFREEIAGMQKSLGIPDRALWRSR